MRVLRAAGREVVGLDVLPSPFTSVVGSVADRDVVRESLAGVTGVLHTATLHKPHIGSHDRQAFVDTNVTGTLTLLEEAVAAGVESFVFTSTTSAFGRALYPGSGAPAAWITEDVVSLPRNVYGVTKTAAEDLCELVHRDSRLPVVVLRTSRFFPEGDDRDDVRSAYEDANSKANEYLYRRVDIADVVDVHLLALERAAGIGFGRYIVSATTPFARDDVAELATDAPSVVRRLFPDQEAEYARRGWKMFPQLDRVYVNARARGELGWAAALRLPPRARPARRPARTSAARSRAPSAPRATTRSRPGPTPCAEAAVSSADAPGPRPDASRMSEIAPGIHRIEEDLGPRFMAQYLLTGSERTLLVDTGLSQTLSEAIAPYAESIGLGVEAIDELFVSHADVDHIGSNRALRERSPRTRISCGERDRRWVESNEAILAENYRWFEPYGFTLGPDVLGFIAQELGGDAPVDLGLVGGETIRLGPGQRWEVLALPGHTLGHMGLWHPEERTAIIVDAVLGQGVCDRAGAAADPAADLRPARLPPHDRERARAAARAAADGALPGHEPPGGRRRSSTSRSASATTCCASPAASSRAASRTCARSSRRSTPASARTPSSRRS